MHFLWKTRAGRIFSLAVILILVLATPLAGVWYSRRANAADSARKAAKALEENDLAGAANHFEAAARQSKDPARQFENLRQAADAVTQQETKRLAILAEADSGIHPKLTPDALVESFSALDRRRRILTQLQKLKPNDDAIAEQLLRLSRAQQLWFGSSGQGRGRLQEVARRAPSSNDLAKRTTLMLDLTEPTAKHEFATILEKLNALPTTAWDGELLLTAGLGLTQTAQEESELRDAIQNLPEKHIRILDHPDLAFAYAGLQLLTSSDAQARAANAQELKRLLTQQSDLIPFRTIQLVLTLVASIDRQPILSDDQFISSKGAEMAITMIASHPARNSDARYMLLDGQLALAAGRLTEAEELFRQVLRMEPGPSGIYLNLSPVEILGCNLLAANSLIASYQEQLADADSDSIEILNQRLTAIYDWSGKVSTAVDQTPAIGRRAFQQRHWCDAAKILHKGSPADRVIAARALVAANELGAALDILRDIDLSQLGGLRRVNLGHEVAAAFSRVGLQDEAKEILAPLAAALPRHQRTQEAWATVLLLNKDVSGAKTVLAGLPDDAAIHQRLLLDVMTDPAASVSRLRKLPVNARSVRAWGAAIAKDETLRREALAWIATAAKETNSLLMTQIHQDAAALPDFFTSGSSLLAAIDATPPQQFVALAQRALADRDVASTLRLLAEAEQRKISATDPAYASVKFSALLLSRKFEDAGSLLESTKSELAPATARYWQLVLDSQIASTEDYRNALIEFTRDYPFHSLAWSRLGDVHRTEGDELAAKRAYRSALASRPSHSPAVLGLAGLLAAEGSEERAILLLKQQLAFCRSASEFDRYLRRLAAIDDASTVIAIRNALAQNAPGDLANQRQLALAAYPDDPKGARGLAQRLVDQHPENVANQITLLTINVWSGDAIETELAALANKLANAASNDQWQQLLTLAQSTGQPDLVEKIFQLGAKTAPSLARQYADWLLAATRAADAMTILGNLWKQGDQAAGSRLAQTLIQTGELTEAETLIGKLQPPSGESTVVLKAQLALARQKPEQALTLLTSGLSESPYDAEAYWLRAQINRQNPERLASVKDDFETALRLNPQSPKFRLGFADWLLDRQDWDRAEVVLSQAAPLDRANAIFKLRDARLLAGRGKFAEASQLLRPLEGTAYAPYALQQQLQMARLQNRGDLILDSHRRLQALRPNDPIVQNNYAVWTALLGDPQAALTAIQTVIPKYPENSPYHSHLLDTLGFCLLRAGQHEQAAQTLTQSVAKSEFPMTGLYLAQALVKLGRQDEALKAARVAMSTLPDAGTADDDYRHYLFEYSVRLQDQTLAAVLLPYLKEFATESILQHGDAPSIIRLRAATAYLTSLLEADSVAADLLFRESCNAANDPANHLLYAAFLKSRHPDKAARQLQTAANLLTARGGTKLDKELAERVTGQN